MSTLEDVKSVLELYLNRKLDEDDIVDLQDFLRGLQKQERRVVKQVQPVTRHTSVHAQQETRHEQSEETDAPQVLVKTDSTLSRKANLYVESLKEKKKESVPVQVSEVGQSVQVKDRKELYTTAASQTQIKTSALDLPEEAKGAVGQRKQQWDNVTDNVVTTSQGAKDLPEEAKGAVGQRKQQWANVTDNTITTSQGAKDLPEEAKGAVGQRKQQWANVTDNVVTTSQGAKDLPEEAKGAVGQRKQQWANVTDNVVVTSNTQERLNDLNAVKVSEGKQRYVEAASKSTETKRNPADDPEVLTSPRLRDRLDIYNKAATVQTSAEKKHDVEGVAPLKDRANQYMTSATQQTAPQKKEPITLPTEEPTKQ